MPTLKEIYEGQSNWVFGTNYTSLKSDTETLIEQETGGIRVKSAVELNNPLIYGNESVRIGNKTTKSVEDMKNSTGGESSDGGLLGAGISKLTGGKLNSLSDVRNKFNSKLGIPSNAIPTYVDGTGELQKGKEPDTMITLAKIKKDASGTELGKFLKQGGGGNLRTIGRNLLGQGISLVKDKVRDKIFGTPAGLGENSPTNTSYEYSSENSYSTTIRNVKNAEQEPEKLQMPLSQASDAIDGLRSKTKKSLEKNKKIDEKPTENTDYSNELKYSDIVREEATDDDASGEFTRIDLSVLPQNANSRSSKFFRLKGYSRNPYSVDNRYPKPIGDSEPSENMESLYGITNGGDRINSEGLSGNTEELEQLDLVPFWIRPRGGSTVHFRTSVTGLTETVSPSWSSSKFFGNPFSFYTYDGVERNLSLTLQMFCYNATELATMWQKIEFLTKQAYPKIGKSKGIKYSNPPIVQFRLGDMYNNKVSYIESLSYTIPDNSNWETDIKGLQLPKLVDVSITFKFIEQVGDEQTLYSYERSDEAIKLVNEKRGAAGGNFSGDSQTGGGTENIGGGSGADGTESTPPPKVDKRGIPQDETTISEENNSGANSTPKSLQTGKKSTDTPKDENEEQTPERTQSRVQSEADKKEEELKSKGIDDWAVYELKYKNPEGVKKVTDIDGEVGYYYKKVNEVRGTFLEFVAYRTGVYNNTYGEIIGNKKYKVWVSQNLEDPAGTQPEVLKAAREKEQVRLDKANKIQAEKEKRASERAEKLKKAREENLKKIKARKSGLGI